MKKSQKIGIPLLILLMIATIGLCILKIYSETTKNKDMINGNYYTKTTLKEAEFLGKFSYNRRGTSSPKGITHDEFKIIESGEIVKIACGKNTGHTGEKYVTLAIIDYYSKDTNKFLYQKIEVAEVKDYFDNEDSEI